MDLAPEVAHTAGMSFARFHQGLNVHSPVSKPLAFVLYARKNIVRLLIRPRKNVAPHLFTRLTRWNLGYEKELDRLVTSNVEAIRQLQGNAKALFVDCGVNEGIVLRRYIDALGDFDFVGFEIQAELIPRARHANPEADIHHLAVADADGEITIFLPRASGTNFRGGSTIEPGKVKADNLLEKRTVNAIDLWQFIAQKRREQDYQFVVVKLDVEGAEYRLIKALHQHWLEKQEPLVDYLMVEFHPEVLDQAEDQAEYDAKLSAVGVPVSHWV